MAVYKQQSHLYSIASLKHTYIIQPLINIGDFCLCELNNYVYACKDSRTIHNVSVHESQRTVVPCI